MHPLTCHHLIALGTPQIIHVLASRCVHSHHRPWNNATHQYEPVATPPRNPVCVSRHAMYKPTRPFASQHTGREMSGARETENTAAGMGGAVDRRRRPASRTATGGWTAALFIIVVEISERFAYYGVASNLITYLTGPLQKPTAAAAAAVNTWSGVSQMLPFLGAFLADSYLGRYRTIVGATLLYILGLGMLTLFAVLPSLSPPKFANHATSRISHFQVTFFYLALYLVALAQGGHKPCVQAFAADQFDQSDAEERVARISFFNWWYFAMSGGVIATLVIMSYIQDNIGWGLGFGIPCIAMGIALIIFLLGTRKYRYYLPDERNPLIRIAKTLIAMARSKLSSKSHPATSEETCLPNSVQPKPASDWHSSYPNGHFHNVEEAKGVLRLFPIWVTCLIYGVVFAQSSTFFTKQGATLGRRINHKLQIPPAALQGLIAASIFIFVPIYDRVLVPIARKLSAKESGITMLQRIGTGLAISVIAMVVAALVERKRLKTARDSGLLDLPKATVPMSLWWLVPQYVLYGISESFTLVGCKNFSMIRFRMHLEALGLLSTSAFSALGALLVAYLLQLLIEQLARQERVGSLLI